MGRLVARIRALTRMTLKLYVFFAALMFVGGMMAGALVALR